MDRSNWSAIRWRSGWTKDAFEVVVLLSDTEVMRIRQVRCSASFM
jgi:hypothetical protein